MALLVTSDIHLTDKSNDLYRWGLFPWLEEQCIKYKVSNVLLLGDLTDAKDKHTAQLTNRIIAVLKSLANISGIENLICLKGNHDYLVDPDLPYFKFINEIPKLNFVVHPICYTLEDKTAMLLPSTKDPDTDWKEVSKYFPACQYIFCHQTFTGAISENGTELTGLSTNWFKDIPAMIISGDIHTQQKVGNVTYVGAPYRIKFGDRFEPRVLLIEDTKLTDLHFPTLKRHTVYITSSEELENDTNLSPNDQVKVRLMLDNPLEWEKAKASIIDVCKRRNLKLHDCELIKKETEHTPKPESKIKSFTHKSLLEEYIKVNKINPNLNNFGLNILSEVK